MVLGVIIQTDHCSLKFLTAATTECQNSLQLHSDEVWLLELLVLKVDPNKLDFQKVYLRICMTGEIWISMEILADSLLFSHQCTNFSGAICWSNRTDDTQAELSLYSLHWL